MAENVTIGIVCDIHLPKYKESVQYAFLKLAANRMKQDGIQTVICLGDISSYGQAEAWELYRELFAGFEHYEVAGNWDVSDASTRDTILGYAHRCEFSIGSRRVIGINTLDAQISESDKAYLENVKAGDILFMHHYIRSMKEESGQWLTRLAERVPLTIVHGHGHRIFDYMIGDSRVLGMRGLDPDKVVGGFPSISYLHVSEDKVTLEEHSFPLPKAYLEDTSRYFGISCVDNQQDVSYAAEHNVKYVELRCNGGDWKPDMELLPTLDDWRAKTNGYLSVHMPNVYFRNGELQGREKWFDAMAYAITVKADGLTIHPPRASVSAMKKDGDVWNQFLELYVAVAKSVPPTAKIGIENLHKNSGEPLDENRGFGYRPEEVTAWIDAINEKLGAKRVGHVLDVGHARNNGAFSEQYPLSTWYHMMGSKTVAYHIHQVMSNDIEILNHNAIANWFGPLINYTAFFYAWHEGMLNHVPVFLEVKGHKHFETSMAAFKELLKELPI